MRIPFGQHHCRSFECLIICEIDHKTTIHIPTGTACTNGQVRLQNGNTTSEGRVEYCFEGKWNPLCSIDGITASLICKQLGFNSTCKCITND